MLNLNTEKVPFKYKSPIMQPRAHFKPFEYEEFFQAWSKQVSMFWLHTEVSMTTDIVDFYNKMSVAERNLIIMVLRFFTQADVLVSQGYKALFNAFHKVEIQSMIAQFIATEFVHTHAYSFLIDKLNLPENIYKEFLNYEEMVEREKYLDAHDTSTPFQLLRTMVLLSSFTERCTLFSFFYLLIWPSQAGVLKGVAQIVSWSMRDEELHWLSTTSLYMRCRKEFLEYGDITQEELDELDAEILRGYEIILHHETKFLDLVFKECPNFRGRTKEDVIYWIRHMGKEAMERIGLTVPKHLLADPSRAANSRFMEHTITAEDNTDFFANRATTYRKVDFSELSDDDAFK